ncbi:hypothetical protein [Aureibacter tunicatorum]|uniref:Tetratricopeptide repeat protein n=1 Tax=Aureibacter tunicatorum TaxID=866807 RepID=A0AAE4BTC1_9BACT|nr:hypothetical protein [Aureibacter tunicatorum]MDR6239412.1 hypothetical protein [Aureibacter tunicatorum]BDD04665.1 hypothetical protein AUTU_21480 [Aureibacter tunicatorum]
MGKSIGIISFIFFALFFFVNPVKAQIEEEVQIDKEVLIYFRDAKVEMSNGNYEQANYLFRKALATRKVIPGDLCYFFAETLYMLKQYQNASNLIEKYFTLTSTNGDYYDQALELAELIDRKVNINRRCSKCDFYGYKYTECIHCDEDGKINSTCYYCRGTGLRYCSPCSGEGIIITTGPLGSSLYQKCGVCESKGYVECSLCHGEKNIDTDCSVCLGSRKIRTLEICTHD